MTDSFENKPEPSFEGSHPVIPGLTPAVRKWLYGLTVASVPVAIALDLLDQTQAALILPLVTALLSGVVAFPNVNKDK